MTPPPMARVLTIAGSDSGGGAGIEADLKTFAAFGVYGMAAITAVTAQNTCGVRAIHDVPPKIVAAQIDAVAEDIGVDAAKTGMLANAAIVEAVADRVARHGIAKLVVDPVMVSSSGHALLDPAAREVLIRKLLPLACVITPNIPEAEMLSGDTITDETGIRHAAETLFALGPRYVLIKGGHLDAPEAVDYLFDGAGIRRFAAPRCPAANPHGAGCTYSAAIAAGLANGLDVPDAVEQAKAYVTEAIRRCLPLGQGRRPLDHGWPLKSRE